MEELGTWQGPIREGESSSEDKPKKLTLHCSELIDEPMTMILRSTIFRWILYQLAVEPSEKCWGSLPPTAGVSAGGGSWWSWWLQWCHCTIVDQNLKMSCLHWKASPFAQKKNCRWLVSSAVKGTAWKLSFYTCQWFEFALIGCCWGCWWSPPWWRLGAAGG